MRTIEATLMEYDCRAIGEQVMQDNSGYHMFDHWGDICHIEAELISPKKMRRLPAVPVRLKLHYKGGILTVQRAYVTSLDSTHSVIDAHWEQLKGNKK